MQLALSSAADDASAEVARVRDQAARDILDADSRARARIDAQMSEQKAQLAAEMAAMKEERALLDRNQRATEILSSLSAQVEIASSAAIQREERLASRLEADLNERERRYVCINGLQQIDANASLVALQHPICLLLFTSACAMCAHGSRVNPLSFQVKYYCSYDCEAVRSTGVQC